MKAPRVDTLLQQQISDELKDKQRKPLKLALEPTAALELVGILQAAVQQPILTTAQTETAQALVVTIQGYFQDAPTVRATFERSDAGGSSKAITSDNITVGNMALNLRTQIVLRDAGIHTLPDLLQWTLPELMAIPGFNRRALNELNLYLTTAGLSLRGAQQ